MTISLYISGVTTSHSCMSVLIMMANASNQEFLNSVVLSTQKLVSVVLSGGSPFGRAPDDVLTIVVLSRTILPCVSRTRS